MLKTAIKSTVIGCGISGAALYGSSVLYTQNVKQVKPVTVGTLLHTNNEKMNKPFADEFEVTLHHREFNKLRITDQSKFFTAYMQSFFTSSVFGIERTILKLALPKESNQHRTNEEIMKLNFEAPNSDNVVSIFQLVERKPNEALFCWNNKGGYTWFAVDPIEGGDIKLRFGSSLSTQVSTGNEDESSLLRDASFKVMTKFHVMYSKVLLQAAKEQLLREIRAAT